MKKIILLILFLGFFAFTAKTVHAQSCYARLDPGCIDATDIECGRKADGYNVCCPSGVSCPANTPIGAQGSACGIYDQANDKCLLNGQEVPFSVFCKSGGIITCCQSIQHCQVQSCVETAIGCIPFNSISVFTARIMLFGVSVGGGIAFLLIVFAGFQILASQGDKEKLKGGRELLNSAIAGILMLIFATFILRVIGVDILGVIQQ